MARIEVRDAAVADRPAIVAMVRAAFTDDERDGSDEVHVVERSWELDAVASGLELVAVQDGVVVGHVMAAWADLGGRHVAAVAPLAVTPAMQRRGIGTVLMAELLTRAEEAGLPLVALLGSPDYYGRFGFEPSGPLGIVYRPVGPDSPYFQVRRLSAYDESYCGDLTYCWER